MPNQPTKLRSIEEWGAVLSRLCDDSFCFDQDGAEQVVQQIRLEALEAAVEIVNERIDTFAPGPVRDALNQLKFNLLTQIEELKNPPKEKE